MPHDLPYDLTRLQADIAQVWHKDAGFGTGRLVAENLILTAAHVLWKSKADRKAGVAPKLEGWQVRFAGDCTADVSPPGPFRCGNRVVWHDSARDLALIQLLDLKGDPLRPAQRPMLRLRIAAVEESNPHSAEARGYPRAAREEEGRDLWPAFGRLTAGDRHRPLLFGVENYDLPNNPHEGWRGMSGSAVMLRGTSDPEVIWVYGVVQEVPANFDRQLRVARLADAWQQDLTFRKLLVDAGTPNQDAEDPTRTTAIVPVPSEQAPTDYVERAELTDGLLTYLLSDESAPSGRALVSAVHGLGGMGKTTVARWLVWRPEVERRFPDGLWVTLGSEPSDAVTVLNDVAGQLNPALKTKATRAAARTDLATSLQGKSVLLVIDDVWPGKSLDVAKALLVASPRSRFLLTTRFPQLAVDPEIRAQDFPINEMSEAQAFTLIARVLGRELNEAELSLARCLSKSVGGHPLALELSAARIREGRPWEALVNDLTAEIARLGELDETDDILFAEPNLPDVKRKLKSVVASLRLSVRYLNTQGRELFAWLGVVAEDATVTPAMAATLWSTNVETATKYLRALNSAGLISERGDVYRVHDLMRKMARNLLTAPAAPVKDGDLPGLGLTFREAVAQHLERYRNKIKSGLWHTLIEDRYIHDQLVRLFDEAGWAGELEHLLWEETANGDCGWYSARERLSQTAGFFADVSRISSHADRIMVAAVDDDHRSKACALRLHCALIIASINSIAGSIPPALMTRLVDVKEWSPQQGLAYILRIPVGDAQTEALANLARHLTPPAFVRGILGDPCPTAEGLDWRWIERAAALSPALDDSTREGVLSRAVVHLLDANNLYDVMAPWVLKRLGPCLLPRGVADIVDAVLKMRYWFGQSQLVEVLAPLLPEELTRQVLKVVPDAPKLVARLAILGHVKDAFDAAFALEKERRVSESLKELAAHLDEVLVTKALARADGFKDDVARCEALVVLARRLGELNHPDEVLPWIRLALSRPELAGEMHLWTSAIVAVGPFLSPERMAGSLRIARAREYDRDPWLADLIVGLAPNLPDAIVRQEIREVDHLSGKYDRSRAITSLLARLAALNGVQIALDAVHNSTDNGTRSRALAALAFYFDNSALDEVFALVASIESSEDRAAAIGGIAGQLPRQRAVEALGLLRGVRDHKERLTRLVDLAKYLRPLQVESALSEIETEKDEILRFTLLERLAPYVPESHLERATDLALTAPGDINAQNAAKALASRTASCAWPGLLKRLAALSAEALISLVVSLADVVPDEAAADALLNLSEDFSNEARSGVTLMLAMRLAAINRQARAVALVETLVEDLTRGRFYAARALRTMAPALDQPELGRAIGIARKKLIAEPDQWVDVVASLGGRLAAVGDVREALNLLRMVQDATNQVLAPLLDGSRRISVPDLSTWPQALEEVARNGGASLAGEVLELACGTRTWAERAEAVGRVATCLKITLAGDTINSMLSDPNWRRLWTLSKTLPYFAALLPESHLEQLITDGYALVKEAAEQRSGAVEFSFIERLAPWWPAETLSDVVSFTTKAEIDRQTTAALVALLRRMVTVAGPVAALSRVTEAAWRRDSAELLRSLVDLLPDAMITDAFDAALRLCTAEDRAESVTALAARAAALGPDVCASFMQKLLAAEAHSVRPDLLRTVVAFAPALASTGRVEAVQQLAENVQHVGRWWP